MSQSKTEIARASVAQEASYDEFMPSSRRESVKQGIEDAEMRLFNCASDAIACH